MYIICSFSLSLVSIHTHMDLSDYASCVPGPGAYDPKPLETSPKYSLSGRSPKRTTAGAPGPGAYDPKDPRDLGASSPRSSMASRVPAPRPAATPGPGSYDPYKGIGAGSPKSSFSGRTTTRPRQGAPGPGAYDIPTTLGGPSFSMGSRTRMRMKY